MRLLVIIVLLMSALYAQAAHLHPEKFYQDHWCTKFNGIMEYELPDKTRVDCLTKNYAVEFDFASKWAECIGQAMYYGISTNKKPACVLIIEKPTDFKYMDRIKKVSDVLKFEVWYMKAPEYVNKNN